MAAGYGLSDEDIIELWNEFLKILNCKFIPKVEIDEGFAELPLKIRMRLRTLMNFQHLFIAMKEDAYLVTGDADLIKIVRKNKLYGKILSYIELRKLIASSPNL
jgi:predicted nucleic acid-binding protein